MNYLAQITTTSLILIIIGSLALLILLGYFIFTYYFSRYIYLKYLHRKDKTQWGRECSIIDDEEQLQMYNEGLEWGEENKEFKIDVHIINEGYNLYGEYFDFGHKKTAFIHQGRMEACRYSYYFAEPYKKAGFNILVIDPRGHGLSDGEYNTLGFEEHKDVIAWCNFLSDEFGCEEVIMHGICIGAASSLYALISENCPKNLKAMVTEGMYINFYDSFKNHMICDNHPRFPVLQECNMWMEKITGHSMKYGPIDCIHKLDKPILMLQSKEDPYSLPEYAPILLEKCSSKIKKLKMFDRGRHSHLRAIYKNEYDMEIINFIKENNL